MAVNENAGRIAELRAKPAAIAIQLVGLNFALQAAVVTLSTSGALTGFVHETARLTHMLYRLTGVPATLIGNRIYLANIVLTINEDCAGLFVLVGYVALVVSYPASRWSFVRALGLGIPALVAANFSRLLLVGQVLRRVPWAFDMVHDVLFRVAMVLTALLLWYVLSVREYTPWPVRRAAHR